MYAFCQDMPGIPSRTKPRSTPLLPPDALDGCIAHVAGPIEGGSRIIDVWESEAAVPHLPEATPLPGTRQAAEGHAVAGHPRASAVLGPRGDRRRSHRHTRLKPV